MKFLIMLFSLLSSSIHAAGQDSSGGSGFKNSKGLRPNSVVEILQIPTDQFELLVESLVDHETVTIITDDLEFIAWIEDDSILATSEESSIPLVVLPIEGQEETIEPTEP